MLAVGVIGEIDLLLYLLTKFGEGEEGEEGGYYHRDIQLRMTAEGQQSEIEGKHALDELPGQTEILNAEEDPDEIDRKEGEYDAWYLTDFLHHIT